VRSVEATVISDFHVGTFAGYLGNDEGEPAVTVVSPDFGRVVPQLLALGDAPRDLLIVWTRPEEVLPSFARLLAFEAVPEERLLAEVDAFADAILGARARVALVPTWVTPPTRGWGMLEMRRGLGLAQTLMRLNLRLAERLEGARHIFVLDASRWMAAAGRRAHEPRLLFMAKVPFANEVFKAAVADVKAALRGIAGRARKVVVVDLDDTLWGGILGEVGWAALRVGGHDAVGEAFAAFQRGLRALRNRGVLLAIASKNDAATALEALERHPEMILRPRDFSALRIDWSDKAGNIADMAVELNVGLDSLVFLDDSPIERGRVREALPQVLVPELPEDKLLLATALAALDCFDAPAVTGEDVARADMMAAGREREDLRRRVGSVDDWLRGLAIEVRLEPLAPGNLQRATQLLNKTNQMNLRTRRLTEEEYRAFGERPGCRAVTLRVADRFGDLGLTGLVGVEVDGDTAHVLDFALSCRAMARRVEEVMVHVALEIARAAGAATLQADYAPTEKNRPCLEFWRRSGFRADGHRFHRSTAEPYPAPASVTLSGSLGGGAR